MAVVNPLYFTIVKRVRHKRAKNPNEIKTELFMFNIRLAILLILASTLFAGCGSAPKRSDTNQTHRKHAYTSQDNPDRLGARAADVAAQLLGKPYRYGGNTPAGFDCSGLVQYSYRRVGVEVPRSTGEQLQETRSVERDELQKGDLLFFNQEGKRSSHVAIYLGNDTFIHAPSSGKRVRRDRLGDPYWRKHFFGARRIY